MEGSSGTKWFAGIFLILLAVVAYSPVTGSPSSVETISAAVTATPHTVNDLVDAASRGTRILLSEGEYGPLSIVDKFDLHLVAAPGARVVISSGTLEDGTAVRISGSSNITVAGMHIEQSYRGITVDESFDVSLRALAVDNLGQRGIQIENDSSRVLIEDSRITRTGRFRHQDPDVTSVYASYGAGIHIGDSDDPTDRPSDITIRNNYIAKTGSEAIDIQTGSHGVSVSGNVIEEATPRSGAAITIHPGKAVSAPDIAAVIEYNIIRTVHAPAGEGKASAILVSGPARVRANALWDIEQHGVSITDVVMAEPDKDSPVVEVTHNIVYSTGDEPIYRYPHRKLRDDDIRIGPHLTTGPIDRLRSDTEDLADVSDARITEMLRSLSSEAAPAEAPGPRTVDRAEQQQPRENEPPATVAPTTTAPTSVASRELVSGRTATPVYDTAWQMLVRGTPKQADAYFAELSRRDFTGAWAAIIHHRPATYLDNYAGGGQVGWLQNGQVVLNPDYVKHVRTILDMAQRHGQKVGLVAAWQNTYLPGGDTGTDQISNRVEGTVTVANARAYGRQIAKAFGDHPAVSMWVFGGDAGTNNTEANKAVWREMAAGVRGAGGTQPINYHTPTVHFDQLNYVGEQWLDMVAPETGHTQGPGATEQQLRAAVAAYSVPVWAGEPRYFGIDFDWIAPQFRNPGVAEVRADAEAAKRAGVSGYLYGDAGRWAWCLFQTRGDTSPCNADNIAASFGPAEDAVINVFR